ncbi:hypothetical protein SAMN05216548_114126 [Faunimonas pinastri]|uniref:Uncharacterized protein n=1 Tax=Faunimonas pinastri TaxID=1855383 RepID=A0A1H9N011_9HYPH|nr:hypothetical protein [Faunimonas pinastri]SER29316.1 hypothetical protein SAMN05216548_114126 [Faunimonas pinastri]
MGGIAGIAPSTLELSDFCSVIPGEFIPTTSDVIAFGLRMAELAAETEIVTALKAPGQQIANLIQRRVEKLEAAAASAAELDAIADALEVVTSSAWGMF